MIHRIRVSFKALFVHIKPLSLLSSAEFIMDIGPGSGLRQLMREDNWEAMSDPWTLAAPGIFRDWARVVSFSKSRAMAVRHRRTAIAQLSLIAPVNFDSDFLFSELPESREHPFLALPEPLEV